MLTGGMDEVDDHLQGHASELTEPINISELNLDGGDDDKRWQ